MGDSHMGLQARLMSQALRKLSGAAHRTGTTIVFINQLRMKIGGMFGSPETTTGGHALKYYASVRLDIRRIGAVKQGDEVLGNRTRVKVVKNKLAPPFRKAEFDIRYGKGIDALGDLLDRAVEAGVVEKSGAYYRFQGKNLAQGRENTRAALERDSKVRDQITAGLSQPRGSAKRAA
jgi:recombination protein RecA